MSSLDMLDLLGGIDSSYITEADTSVTVRKTSSWKKWMPAVAACAVIALIMPFIGSIFKGKGGTDGSPDVLENIRSLEINGCYYEASDIPEVLERYGLPETLTPDLAGGHVSYLESNGAGGYLESAAKTDIEMFLYAPDPCRGVYIINDQGHYYAAIFCNFILITDDASVELSELYRMYGIESARDIASISETDWHRNKTAGKTATDPSVIQEFFRITCSLESNSNREFQAEVFDGIPEEEQQNKHTAFADDCRSIRIETVSGLRFYIEVYPKFGWIYGTGTLSYFRITPDFSSWFEANM